MVNRQDIRNINRWMNGWTEEQDDGTTVEHDGFINAMDTLEEIYEDADAMGADPATHPDFEAAQEEVKKAVAGIVNEADDAVDRTGDLEDEDGNVRTTLPNAALSRSGSTQDLPNQP